MSPQIFPYLLFTEGTSLPFADLRRALHSTRLLVLPATFRGLPRAFRRRFHGRPCRYVEQEATLKTTLPEACELLRDTTPGFHRSVDIFDFSERKSMQVRAPLISHRLPPSRSMARTISPDCSERKPMQA